MRSYDLKYGESSLFRKRQLLCCDEQIIEFGLSSTGFAEGFGVALEEGENMNMKNRAKKK